MANSGSNDEVPGTDASTARSMSPTPPRPWPQAWGTYQPILDAVADLHGKGLVHGNLSLASFEFTESGTLTDASLERLQAQSATPAAPDGGPYTAPECSLETRADEPRVDVYSLGVILYELLCGRLPWPTGLDGAALRELKAGSKLPNPKRFQSAIPLDVLKVLRASTSGSPQVRPQSAVVMRALLGPAGHSINDEKEASSLSLDAEEQLAEKASIDPPPKQAGTNLNQLPTDPAPTDRQSGTENPLDEALTAVLPATNRPGTNDDPTPNPDAPTSSRGNATTTVIQGVQRPELATQPLENTETVTDTPASLNSGVDLAAGAVTTLHPASIRPGAAPLAEPDPNSPGQLEDIRALLGSKDAIESTEVLAFSEDAPGDGPALRDDTNSAQPAPAKPKGRRRKKRKSKSKGSRPAGGLPLVLALGLAVLVFVALSYGLIKVRSLAEGPDPSEAEELLRLSDSGQQAKSSEERGDSPDPYSERWKELEAAEPSAGPEANGEDDTNKEDPAPSTLGTQTQDQERKDNGRLRTASSSTSRRTPAASKTRPSARTKPAAKRSPKESDASDTVPSPEVGLKLRPTANITAAQVGRRTLFSVGIDGPAPESRLTVKLHMRCVTDGGRWRLYKMKRSGPKTWDHRVNFAIADRGRCDYYFTARTEGDTPSASLGSKSKPFEVQVR